ncbi:unnamed protein product [Rotaria socialis]|uniref:Uncharacterized protein n=1 Tax=Rotaria socialis TaxID=392032 RepID=A0A818SEP3_9BILA|nr:unnamed protein product [Rotaria socialis]CAF3433804.1 unnamed protein product [Rotaria socialis]CAF3658974.1 unnamed protein product [Rotaria socialis]CAF3666316.1 unnamed protein product [Rotaria socialis]CAF3716652.1 unnamed protein product [Rotaria socialis]
MCRLPILIVFICILLNQQQVACVRFLSYDEIERSPYPSRSLIGHNAWYNYLNDMDESEQHEPNYNLWKRVASKISSTRQRRRFGNTRYGRSLPST